ncbi:MAG TPA: TIGR00282 family metallophosphoesterase [Candidatus Dormibacteraeota bacterium]|nr:TIGR00282 family metallophosphoesterase [Candidatus Dormibacteraeota bacterium]
MRRPVGALRKKALIHSFNLLLVGDVVGSPGREALKRCLPELRERFEIHACIANAENIAGGFGLTVPTVEELFACGVDFLTSGNHVWDKRDYRDQLSTSDRIVRPANYPEEAPGHGYGVIECNGFRVGVVNVMGRVFMPDTDDPFRVARRLVEDLRHTTPIVIVDVHAEATSEKAALAYHLDGLASAVFGTHTHVQTADERILAGGTAFITDVGMTGPSDSIIGMDVKIVLERFLMGTGERFAVAKTTPRQVCALVVNIDPETGHAVGLHRIFQRFE